MRPSELGLAHSSPTLRSQNSDVFTILLDGTILPSVARALVLAHLSLFTAPSAGTLGRLSAYAPWPSSSPLRILGGGAIAGTEGEIMEMTLC